MDDSSIARSSYYSDSTLASSGGEEEEDELGFMNRLKSADWKAYCFQKDMIRHRPAFPNAHMAYKYLRPDNENQSFPIVRARDLDGGVKHYSFDELLRMTDRFESTICYTLFGTLHQGTIQKDSGRREVLVKTWEFFFPITWPIFHHPTRIHDELNLLRDPDIKSLPNVVNLIGFHCERRLAAIYELGGSVQCLHEIIPTDTFSWNDRMKVATDMASMLEAFHNKGLVHGGVHSKTVVVDEDKLPVVYDFRLLSYSEGQEEYEYLVGKLYCCHKKYLEGPPWSMKCDIFAYGILLLELINKRVYDMILLPLRTKDEILNYDHKKSAVDVSFHVDKYIALGITKLVVNCLKVDLDEQPIIGDIVRELKDLMLSGQPNRLHKISY